MWAYLLLFLVPAGIAFSPIKGDKNTNYMLWAIVGLLGILLIGLRYEVGGDWVPYLVFLDEARGLDLNINNLLDASYGNATGYVFLNWAAIQLGFGIYGIYFVNTICSCFFLLHRDKKGCFISCSDLKEGCLFNVIFELNKYDIALGF